MSAALAVARTAFAALVDDRVGIIERVDMLRPAPGAPEVFVAHAQPCDTRPLTGLAAANRGAAASADPQRAVVRACGESVERYCSAFFDLSALPLVPAHELAADGLPVIRTAALYPFAEHQYSEPGFPFEPTHGRAQRWVLARSADAHEDLAWVPASAVYVPYLFDRSAEPFTHMPISTGLAAGGSVADCVDKGILEILERDALMIRWHAWLAATGIAVDSCRGLDPLLDRTLAAGLVGHAAWHLSLITLDVEVPVVVAALIDPGDPPLTSVGVSAHQDPVRAVLLAAEEALLTRVLLLASSELAEGGLDVPATTLRGHMLAHAGSPRLRRMLSFLVDPPVEVAMSQVVDRFAPAAALTLPEHLGQVGARAWWVDVTTPDIAVCGLHVARTVIPGFQPLDNDHRHRYLGGRRLHAVPRAMGVDVDALVPNPHPHPFP